jgi:hypothetical protein
VAASAPSPFATRILLLHYFAGRAIVVVAVVDLRENRSRRRTRRNAPNRS